LISLTSDKYPNIS